MFYSVNYLCTKSRLLMSKCKLPFLILNFIIHKANDAYIGDCNYPGCLICVNELWKWKWEKALSEQQYITYYSNVII